MLGIVIGERLATLHELQTVYSTEDVYLMLEVLVVTKHNDNLRNGDNDN